MQRFFISDLPLITEDSYELDIENELRDDSCHTRTTHDFATDATEDIQEPSAKRLRTDSTRWNCEICGTSYSEKRTLVRHLKTPAHCNRAQIPTESYACWQCNRVFSRDDLRQRHIKEVHQLLKRSNAMRRPGSSVPALVPSTTSSRSSWSSESSGSFHSSSESSNERPSFSIFRMPDLRTPEIESIISWEPKRNSAPERNRTPQLTLQRSSSNAASMASTVGFSSVCSPTLQRKRLSHAALLYKGASPRHRSHKSPVLCALCQEHLGTSVTEVRGHLQNHAKLLDPKFSCQECQVTFVRENDLALHEWSAAAKGHCGFHFDHIDDCHGHHPPDVFSEMLTDNDRLQFSIRLQHWEQAQLRAHLEQVNEIVQEQTGRFDDDDCWSFGGMLNSLITLSSALGDRTPRSAIEPGEKLSRLDRSKLPFALGNFDKRRKTRNLALAVLRRDTSRVEELIADGSDVKAPYSHGALPGTRMTPLQAAIVTGDLKLLNTLVLQGAIAFKDEASASEALSSCIEHRRIEVARTLLNHAPGYIDRAEVSSSVLAGAVRTERLDLIGLLMDHGAANASPSSGEALAVALSQGNKEVIRLLLYRSTKSNQWHHILDAQIESNGSQMLKGAAKRGDLALALRIRQHAANVQAVARCTSKGSVETTASYEGVIAYDSFDPSLFALDEIPEIEGFAGALHYAAFLGRSNAVETLLSQGADPNLEFGNLSRPLAWAISQGHKQVVEVLLDRGANVNLQTGPYYNALKCALGYGRKEIAMLLLDRGARFVTFEDSAHNRCGQ